MSRNEHQSRHDGGRLRRAASAVKRLFTRSGQEETTPQQSAPRHEDHDRTASPKGRAPQRTSDIPLDVLDRSYNPPMTSSKASFRSDGADRQLDQEFALGTTEERWNDEDRLTNRSGDPRIGTHGRTYEPAGSRDETRESK